MERSAIILSGNLSKGSDNSALLQLDGRSLIDYVVDAVKRLADEVIIVTNSQEEKDHFRKAVSSEVKFIVNQKNSDGILAQALVGFEVAQGEYSLLLSSGSAFVLEEIASLLFELCIGKAAVIPRWTNQEIEPLHAVYNTQQALEASKAALVEGEMDMEAMVEKLMGVRYLSTMVIEQLDPEFKSFFIIKGAADLKKALSMRNPKPQKTKRKKR